MAGATPPRPTRGQKLEPHGGQGSGGDPGTVWRDVQVVEGRVDDKPTEEKAVKAGGWTQAFSHQARSREPGRGAEHAVRTRDGRPRRRGGAADHKNPEVG